MFTSSIGLHITSYSSSNASIPFRCPVIFPQSSVLAIFECCESELVTSGPDAADDVKIGNCLAHLWHRNHWDATSAPPKQIASMKDSKPISLKLKTYTVGGSVQPREMVGACERGDLVIFFAEQRTTKAKRFQVM